jgi:hypothetical protein
VIKKIFLILFLTLFIVKPVFAGNDIAITCKSGSECTKSSELPLFSENNIYPGFSVSQNFSVNNKRSGPCHLKFKAASTTQLPDILSKQLLINIDGENGYNFGPYRLNELLDPSKPAISLGHVNKGDINDYIWSVVFDDDSTNEYQNQKSAFDISINFECDEESADNPSSVTNNPPSNQGTSECTMSTPQAPTHLVANRLDSGNISLTWDHSVSNHTGYLIAYGTSPGNYLYGAPDVGNVTSLTVQGLTYGAQYCFYVRSLNGCMPGGRTPEYCVNPGSTVIPANNVPTGFQPQVLGETDTTPSEETDGNVKGVLDLKDKTYLPLLFILAFILNTLILSINRNLSILTLLISLLAYFGDKYFIGKYTCSIETFCRYFWVGSILSFLIPLFFSRLSKRK